MLPKAPSVVFGALLAVVTAWALGRLVLRRWKLDFAREEEHLFAFVAGSAVYSLLILALAFAHLIYDATFLAVGATALGAAWKTGAFRSAEKRLTPLPTLWRWLFWLVYAAFALVAITVAMAPEMSPDGSSYHLATVSRYYRSHAMVPIVENMYAHLSQGLEMLFLAGWAFGRHSSAALVHAAFLLTLPLLMLRYGQRVGHPYAGAAAALFTFLSPVVLIDGSSAYNDMAVACVFFAIFYLCEMEAPAALLGLLGGFAFTLKYTAFLALVYIFLRLCFKRRWKDLFWMSAAAGAVVAPWLVRNWLWYQNPVSPLFNVIFENPFIHVSFEQDYQISMRWYPGLESWKTVPLELTVRGGPLGGLLGPLFLLAPLALLGLRNSPGRRALLAAVLFASPYPANVGTRFLIPALPFVAMALAAGLPRHVLPLLVAAHAFLSFPDQPKRYCTPWAWRISDIPWKAALRIGDTQAWLADKWPPYRQMRMIEDRTDKGSVVYVFGGVADSYTSREVRVAYESARNEALKDHMVAAMVYDMQPVHQNEFRFEPGEFRRLRLTQNYTPPPEIRDIWSITEMRVLEGGRELPRVQDWRLDARPYPWDIQYAFDNNPITRWRSWRWLRDGFHVDLDFGRLQRADAVRLEMTADQWQIKMKLEGQTASGQWKELSREPKLTSLPPPLGLRRMAMEMLKREGITHLVVTSDDFRWEDFRDRAELWGIREVGAMDNMRLYRLE